MATSTVRLHRILRAPPERVYRAFLNADAMVKWSPPIGGEYLELAPKELIRYTDKFEDPNLPGVIQVTVSLTAVSCGTELNVVQEGIPDVIPVEMCYLGWQESLVLLAKLVAAEIRE